MSEDGRSQEYLDENFCSHDDLYVDSIKVKVQAKPFGSRPEIVGYVEWFRWHRFLASNGTEMFELYAEVVCERCGATQEQQIDVKELVDSANHNLRNSIDAEWIE